MQVSAESLQEEVLGLEKQQTDTMTRLEALRRAAASQERIAEEFATADTAKALAEYREVREERDTLLSDHTTRLAQIAGSQVRVARLAKNHKSLDEAIAAANAHVQEAERAIKSELETRAETPHLPPLRMTNRREIGLIVRYGRFFSGTGTTALEIAWG